MSSPEAPGPSAGGPTGPPTPAPVPPPDVAAVAAAYGLGRPVGPATLAARGELGRIWHLETGTGRWAVKELLQTDARPLTDLEADARADVAFQEAALAIHIPMPRPVRRPDDGILAEVEAGDRRVTVRVYTWVELADREPRADPLDAAAILGRLHDLAHPDERPPDPWFTRAPDREWWVGLAADAHRAGAAWAATLDGVLPELLAGGPVVAAGRHAPTIRCHLDFNPQNVLVDTTGRAVVVDWENSGPAAAEQELASALAEFVPDPAGTAAFLRSYREAGGPATLHGRSSFAMTLAVQANLVAWYAARALDPTSSDEDRARSEHWMRDIAANAFTVERIDRWLEATRAIG